MQPDSLCYVVLYGVTHPKMQASYSRDCFCRLIDSKSEIMTDKEKIRAELERRKSLADKQKNNGYFFARSDAYAELLNFIDSMPEESIEYNPFDDFRHTDSEEPVSEDMEAEFFRAAHNLREQPTLSAWFRHFYNLGKQQIMKDAVDGVTKVDNNGNILLEANLNHLAKSYDFSQRVKLVIIGED